MNTPCWEWSWSRSPEGYGKWQGRYVHRLFYEAMHGEMPPGFEVDHLCRNRACVNPDHLESVTAQENKRRAGPIAFYGTCRAGHLMDDTNTRLYNYKHGGTRRICRACHSARNRKAWRKKRESGL